MKVVYAPRVKRDLAEIAKYSRSAFGPTIATGLEGYIRVSIARIVAMSESGEQVSERPGVRVVPLIRYPFRIFYTSNDGSVTILHIRHTARRQWTGNVQ